MMLSKCYVTSKEFALIPNLEEGATERTETPSGVTQAGWRKGILPSC